MKIPILSGIYTDGNGDYKISYPRNLIPEAKETGINSGYLRPADGIIRFSDGLGRDRGGINWNGACYRVQGRSLVSINANGIVTKLGTVSGSTPVVMDYSFDRLAINAGKNLYYYDSTSGLQQVTDTDLGNVYDMLWIDGYFMTTDGEYLIVTELNDPFSVNPLKYGSSEIDPDPIERILKLRNEVHAINRYTSEVFRNVGGSGFPFARVNGAQSTRGCVGNRAACIVGDVIMMVGGARNEGVSVWAMTSGNTVRVATDGIDDIIANYSARQLASIVCEQRLDADHLFFYIHLPDITLVYDVQTSQVLGTPVWFTLTSGLGERGQYRARYFTYCYNKWICGDPSSYKTGVLTKTTMEHYGDKVSWDFGTQIVYNEGRGAIFHQLELAGTPSRFPSSNGAQVWTEYSANGATWSNRRYTKALGRGSIDSRIVWLQMGHMINYRAMRFGGDSDSAMSVARLEAQLEPLYV